MERLSALGSSKGRPRRENRSKCKALVPVFILVAAALAICVDPATACMTVFVESNQELFREAVLVYEAEALEAQHQFVVKQTLRGPKRERVVLTWPGQRLDLCEGHQATVPGEKYLVTIQCAEPAHGDVFTCPSRAEPIETAERRLRYLRESYPLTRKELADTLRRFLSGRLNVEKLALWVHDMSEIAEVSDWQEQEDLGTVSLLLGALSELDFALNGRGVPLAELECEIRELKETAIPLLVSTLEESEPSSAYDDIELLSEAFSAADDVCR